MPIFDSYVLSVALFLVSMATEPQQHVSFKSSLENNAINKSGILYPWYEQLSSTLQPKTLPTVFPLRKFYTEQMFVLLRTERMQLLNHACTQPVKRFQR